MKLPNVKPIASCVSCYLGGMSVSAYIFAEAHPAAFVLGFVLFIGGCLLS